MVTARVDTLIFKRSAPPARMGIRLASIYDKGKFEQLWAVVKGKVINFFIAPIRIDDQGNKTMLDFGLTLYKGKKEFTFPKARNLKQSPERTKLPKTKKTSSTHG